MISFIVSAYKSERFIDRRMKNLLVDQTRDDCEVIVVDSCSPENEKEIVEKWQSIYPDRVQYIRQDERTNYGVSWLEGWRVARGDIVCNANTDDLCDSRFVEVVEREFANMSPLVGFAYTGIKVVNENMKLINCGLKPPFNFQEYSHTCYGGPMLIWRNDSKFLMDIDIHFLLLRAKRYFSAFDYTLALYFMSLGYTGYSIQEMLTIYVQRQDSIENSRPAENTYESLCSIVEFFPHHMQGKLKCYKEFAGFPTVPNRARWVQCKTQGKKWSGKYGYENFS